MQMGNFDEAESLLLEALNKVTDFSYCTRFLGFSLYGQVSKSFFGWLQDAKDPETLANLVVCSLQIGKSSSRYLR